MITYHFPFDDVIVGGRLRATLACFHWDYSQGRALLYASTDGADWQVLDAIDAPAEIGHATSGGWNDDLPAFLVGASDIWLRVELYSWGERAYLGDVWVNTAQHSRWSEAGGGNTFELEVALGE